MQQLPNSLQALVVSKDWWDRHPMSINLYQMPNLRILMCDGSVMLTSPLPKNMCWFRGRRSQGVENILLMTPPSKKLVILDIAWSHFLRVPIFIVNMENLEDLNLCGCSMLSDSFGSLKHLKKLNLQGSRIKSLPKSFGELGNLEYLNLSSCKELSMLPNAFGSLKHLKKLDLRYSGIKNLPESFGELSNLEDLDLFVCKELMMLPNSF